jgi:hypothetical protein
VPTADYLPILKRTGLALLIVGILDIGLMVYAVVSQISYSSSLNIFAVIAGVFLLRGSLRAASLVRWFALFLLAALISVALVAPILQPIDLTLTQLQINPLAFLGSLAFFALMLMLFAWLARELGSAPVVLARKNASRPIRRPSVPLALGVALAVILTVISVFVQRSESAARAVREARAALGDDYRYHVSSLNYRSSGEGKSVSGVVTAWKSGSVTDLPFQWRE